MMRWSLVVAGLFALGGYVAAGCSGDEYSPTPTGGTTAVGGQGGGTTGGTGGTGGTSTGGTGGTGVGGQGGSVQCFDADDDGVTDCEGDCDDDEATTHPGAPEICGDTVDNNCVDGADETSICVSDTGTWVSELTGDNANPGTQAAPVKTIGQGILNAIAIGGGHDVYVAEGSYVEKVTLVEGISLWGGYSCTALPCSWDRDPSTYVSEIESEAGDREGVLADVSVTSDTTLDGFTIEGLDVTGNGSWYLPGTAAVTVRGGTPVLSNNAIYAGDETSCSSDCGSFGVRVLGPTNDPSEGLLIQDNDIFAGASNRNCSALVLPHPPAPVVKAIGNWMKGGTCPNARTVLAWSAGVGTYFHDNDIFAGTTTTALSNRSSYAMHISGYVTLDANRINAKPTETGSCPHSQGWPWCGGILSMGATAVITNNVIFGIPALNRSVALYMTDHEIPYGMVTVNGNTLDAGGDDGAGLQANMTMAMACRTDQGVHAKVGRIANNILLAGEGNWRYGFYQEENPNDATKTCEPIFYESNDIFFRTQTSNGDYAHRQWPSGGPEVLLNTVNDVNQLSYAQNNFTGNPEFKDAESHLDTSSPCIDQGTATDAPPTDMDGDPRPQGAAVDVGADEAN